MVSGIPLRTSGACLAFSALGDCIGAMASGAEGKGASKGRWGQPCAEIHSQRTGIQVASVGLGLGPTVGSLRDWELGGNLVLEALGNRPELRPLS